MSRYIPQPVRNMDDVYRELQRLSIAISQPFDEELVWEDLRTPATAFVNYSVNPVTSKPDFDQLTALGSVKTYCFDGATDETVFFLSQMPHAWKQGTAIRPHLHITPKVGTTNATTIWTLEYTIANYSATFGATTTITATASISAAYQHKIISFPEISATNGIISMMMIGAITRLGSADTYTQDTALLEFDIHYQLDGSGSVKEYDKYGN